MSPLINEGILEINQTATYRPVTVEKLDPQILVGKQLFYDARDTRLAKDAYMSCASCHNDGGHDGRVWDFTGTGEGLRNTISLNGRGGPEHGRIHWSGNFDEVHDFESQIRSFAGGTGLMSDTDFNNSADPFGTSKAGKSSDLDALAAYVNSLTTVGYSPFKASNGELTEAAEAGRILFKNNSCTSCHSGDAYTDSATNVLHNIGTIKASSGDRLGQSLTGLDTPTLIGLWETAPYLHDGSATTLAEAVQAHDGVNLTNEEMGQLVAFLQQIDDLTPAVAPNVPPTLQNPGNQENLEEVEINLSLQANDVDDFELFFSATGLPTGLSIDAATGKISGMLSEVGEYTVSVTVKDGADTGETVSFTWLVKPQPKPIVIKTNIVTVSTEENFIIPLNVVLNNTHQSLKTMAFNLTYDSSIATATQCILVQGISGTCDISQAGKLVFSGDLDTVATTNLAPLNVSFKAIGADGTNSPLQIEVVGMTDGENIDVTLYEIENGLILIQNANVAPSIENPGNQTAKVGDPVLVQLNGSDPDGDDLTFSGEDLPDGLTISANGLISGTPTQAGTFNSTLTVDDGRGGQDVVAVNWVISESTTGPSDYTLTINQGEPFTNDAAVSLTISPAVNGEVQFSNTANYSETGWVSATDQFDWSIDANSAPGSLNIVNAWIRLEDGTILGPIKDGIIYDAVRPTGSFTIEVNPEGDSLEDDVVLLHLKSSDVGSGVATMRISNQPDMSGSSDWIDSKAVHYWKMSGDWVYVQFRDRAGNVSVIYQNDINNTGGTVSDTRIFLPLMMNNFSDGMSQSGPINLNGEESSGALAGIRDRFNQIKDQVFGSD